MCHMSLLSYVMCYESCVICLHMYISYVRVMVCVMFRNDQCDQCVMCHVSCDHVSYVICHCRPCPYVLDVSCVYLCVVCHMSCNAWIKCVMMSCVSCVMCWVSLCVVFVCHHVCVMCHVSSCRIVMFHFVVWSCVICMAIIDKSWCHVSLSCVMSINMCQW
jgi:hypothetical protein